MTGSPWAELLRCTSDINGALPKSLDEKAPNGATSEQPQLEVKV